MAEIRPWAALRGRDHERAVLDRLLQGVRAGRSGVLMLRGETGIGKTALLGYLLEQSEGWRVARAMGVQSEMELAFAGLQQLCGPLLDGLERLPLPQRDAIRVAFGLTAGPAPDRFMVGLAVLGLLSGAAANRPVVCARDGRSNQEIGGQLFISPKTLEYHLHKAFAKLGIRSRHQLERVLRPD